MHALSAGRLVFLLLLAASALPFLAYEQRQPSRPQYTEGTFALGLSQDDVVKRLGKRPFGGYVRRTRLSEYKLDLRYGADDSTSRLHPTTRLESVDIAVDRPLPVNVLLQDIPEAVDLCANGCSLLGVFVDGVGNYEPHIIAYAQQPTVDELRLAAALGTHWRAEEATQQWVPAVILKWKTSLPEDYPPDWLNQRIETARFAPVVPLVETHRMSRFAKRAPVELGTWKPKPKN